MILDYKKAIAFWKFDPFFKGASRFVIKAKKVEKSRLIYQQSTYSFLLS
ncbi:MAG: hypothetical protein AAFR77_01015 [Cyanobacteria bacterium J06631_2]